MGGKAGQVLFRGEKSCIPSLGEASATVSTQNFFEEISKYSC